MRALDRHGHGPPPHQSVVLLGNGNTHMHTRQQQQMQYKWMLAGRKAERVDRHREELPNYADLCKSGDLIKVRVTHTTAL